MFLNSSVYSSINLHLTNELVTQLMDNPRVVNHKQDTA